MHQLFVLLQVVSWGATGSFVIDLGPFLSDMDTIYGYVSKRSAVRKILPCENPPSDTSESSVFNQLP